MLIIKNFLYYSPIVDTLNLLKKLLALLVTISPSCSCLAMWFEARNN